MSAWWQMLQPWAAVIVPTLLHFLWQGALLALIGGVTIVVCRKSNPSTRYAVFLGLFALMAITPLITAAVVIQGVPLALPVSSPQMGSDPFATPHWPSQWHTDEAMSQFTAWQPFVLIAWLIGVALCSLRLTGGLMWYVWLTRRLEPIPHELAVVVKRLSQRLGLSARVRVMLSHDVREPLAMRIIQPLIVLPASWLLSAPPLVVEAVLAHELSHIRRHDLWVNLLQRAVETLLFFHPAVWWLSRRIRRERELCCDMLAVAATGRAVEYAQALEAVARFRLAWSSPAMAAGMGGDRMALLERVRRVLGLETATETGWWPVGVAGLLLATACGAGVMLSSGVVQGDDEKPAAKSAEKDGEDELPSREKEGERDRREEDRPRPPRESDRREGGDRPPGERPRGEGDRRPEERPRDGERRPEGGPRDGDRRPEERPREGDRGPRGGDPFGGPRGPMPEGDVMRELLMTIRELRNEVQMLREEVRSIRRPGEGGEGRPLNLRSEPRFDGRPDARPAREGDFGPREDGRRPSPEARDPGPRREGQPRPEGRDAGPRRESRDPNPRPDAAPRPESAPRAGVEDSGQRTESRVDETAHSRQLLQKSRAALKAGHLDEARRFAVESESLKAEYGLFDDRPEIVLADIVRRARAIKSSSTGATNPDVDTTAP